VRHLEQPLACPAEVLRQHLSKGRRGMERRHRPREVQRVADVAEPCDLAIRGVEERCANSIEVVWARAEPASVPLRLSHDVLRTRGRSLTLHDADDMAVE